MQIAIRTQGDPLLPGRHRSLRGPGVLRESSRAGDRDPGGLGGELFQRGLPGAPARAGPLSQLRLTQQLLYGVEPTDPLTFVTVSVFFAGVGGYQNRKIRVTLNPRRHSSALKRCSAPTRY